jgi:hypothetical protein
MPVETNRPAAANRAKCFLIILLSLFASLKGNVSKVQLFRLEPAHRQRLAIFAIVGSAVLMVAALSVLLAWTVFVPPF